MGPRGFSGVKGDKGGSREVNRGQEGISELCKVNCGQVGSNMSVFSLS